MVVTSNTHTFQRTVSLLIHLTVIVNVRMRKYYAKTSQYFPPELNKITLAVSFWNFSLFLIINRGEFQ